MLRETFDGLPFSTWGLSKRADFLVAEGVVDDISHEGLRVLLRDEGVSFQRIKAWKTSKDPEYEAKEARVEHLYAIADGKVIPELGEPTVVFCLDEFGPLNLMAPSGRHWAERGGRHKDPEREPRPRRRATYNRNDGVRHLFAAYDLTRDHLFGHVKPRKKRAPFGPPQPQRAGQHDPPLHRLAEPRRREPRTPPHRRPGERGLIRH